MPLVVGQRCGRHLYPADRPVGPDEAGLEDTTPAVPALGEPSGEFGLSLAVQEAVDGPPDELLAGQPEQPGHRLVAARGASGPVEPPDAFPGGVRDTPAAPLRPPASPRRPRTGLRPGQCPRAVPG